MTNTETFGYIIILQYKNVLNKIVQKAHCEVFATELEAREQMGVMITENSKAMMWICEIPLLDFVPQLIAVK